MATGLNAQQAGRTEPVTGMRDNGTGYHALVGAPDGDWVEQRPLTWTLEPRER
jgi:hypothetical protein